MHRRRRGASIDDEAIPTSLRSPAKLVAQREQRQLEHSRSQTDLRTIKEDRDDLRDDVTSKHLDSSRKADGASTPTRPARTRPRRRSTIDWMNASPQVRELKLEDIIQERLADVFFSLHVAGMDEPVYVSEVVEDTMDPSFRSFDLQSCGPAVIRQDELTLKVWAKTQKMEDFQYHIELQVNLRGLQFIGKSLENYRHPLRSNSIIFHMTDGIYASCNDLVSAPSLPDVGVPKSSIHRTLPTSSYGALMRLATLDQCIQDALATRNKLESQIDEILEEHRDSLDTIRSVQIHRECARLHEETVSTVRKRLAALRKKRDDLQSSLAERESLIAHGYSTIQEQRPSIPDLRSQTLETRRAIETTLRDEIHGQRRRICEDLQRIFPITPIPNKALQFTICGVHLPNADGLLDAEDENEVAAGLGFVAHVVWNLGLYLGKMLPYPIHARASSSTIEDPISNIASDSSGGGGVSSRAYPLFIKGAVRYRFEYGAFLLNKDIETLSNHVGLRVMDIRQTLPNLKYLLYICTAGKGELPARKAGGIRALLKGGSAAGVGSPGLMSRTASTESNASVGSVAAEELKRAIGKTPVGGPTLKANGVVVKSNGNANAGRTAKSLFQQQKVLQGSKLRDLI